jgi:hypothetical protein
MSIDPLVRSALIAARGRLPRAFTHPPQAPRARIAVARRSLENEEFDGSSDA